MLQVDPIKPKTDLDREALQQLREELKQWRQLQFASLQSKPEEESGEVPGVGAIRPVHR